MVASPTLKRLAAPHKRKVGAPAAVQTASLIGYASGVDAVQLAASETASLVFCVAEAKGVVASLALPAFSRVKPSPVGREQVVVEVAS